MGIETSTYGIVQSDLLIRTAILEGLDELRQKPWLLDYVFASLSKDELTKNKYGAKDLERARDWFLKTDIKVVMADQLNDPKFPLISIKLLSSNEAEATLGDTHYDSSESVDSKYFTTRPQIVLPPFTPKSYDPDTGTIVLPDNPASLNTNNVFVGQYLFVPSKNEAYQIQDILDTKSFTIPVGSQPYLTGCIVTPKYSFYKVQLESVEFKESYRLTLYVHSEPVLLTYLYSVIMFSLLRGRQGLLEARGLERTIFSAGGVGVFQELQPEVVFVRTIDISGYVRNYWPKDATEMIEGFKFFDSDGQGGLRIIAGVASPLGLHDELRKQGWAMDLDDFTQDSLG